MARKNRLSSLAVIAGAALMAVGSMATQANAAIIYDINSGSIPLSNLLGTGNSIIVGDKIFDNFSYSGRTGDMPLPSNVSITPEILTVDNQTTWGFKISGLFQDTNTPGGSDVVLGYNVHVVDPSQFMITDAHLLGTPDVVGNGNVKVVETWTPTFGSAKIRVYDIEPGSLVQLQDAIIFDVPVASLTVTKDIQAFVVDGQPGNASITSIDQLYSQTPTGGGGIPEPASLGLLAIGSVGLLARRRR